MIDVFDKDLNWLYTNFEFMGLDNNGTKFLLFARALGVSFANTAMVGRQELLLDAADLQNNLRKFGFALTIAETQTLIEASDHYSEGFLRLLGADEIVSFDASSYENAAVVHDFNLPIGDEFKGRFSTVLDGGTLEHVFNFPTAIKNCMEMVREGGHYLSITPTNNHLGHGFYQFSPELFFRVFSLQNGFELQRLIIFEETPNSPWFEVVDPDAVRERVTLVNGEHTMLLVVARKIKTVKIFDPMPQQSDYVAVWTGKGDPTGNSSPSLSGLPLRSLIALPLTAFRKLRLAVTRSLGMLSRQNKHFKKVELPK